MVVHCPRCRRANPDAAVFCYFDGIPLRPGAAPAVPTVEPGAELLFPSGRRCGSATDLREAVVAEWNEGRQMLQKGEFLLFLQKLGRTDLIQSARKATSLADPDIALYNFLDQLPASGTSGPHLELQPRRLVLKKVTVGKQPQVQLTVTNGGNGILQGKLMVSTGQEWIRVERGTGQQIELRAQRNQEVVLGINTRVLLGGQTYSGKLTVITNGGIAEVPIRLDLDAIPFYQAPYQGASSPRDVAQRMLKDPKPGVALLESGEVARWFALNGWSYPVEGEPARGIGAVQQFFECLGLSRPPPLQLSEASVRLRSDNDQVAAGQVTLRTPSRKWVYAQVTSDAPWLRITTPSASGPQQIPISFEVDPANLAAGQVHQSTVHIRANGNQKLQVTVQVEVVRKEERRRKKDESRRAASGSSFGRPVLVGALLGLVIRLLLVLPADLFARLWRNGPGAATLEAWAAVPGSGDGFLRASVLATWWLGGLIGMGLVGKQGGKWSDRLCGLAAGSAAGLVGCSVLVCLLILVDTLPRAIMQGLAGALGGQTSPWVATPLWILTASGCWALLGGGAGLALACLGPRGVAWVYWVASPLAALCRFLRLKGLAQWMQG